MKNWNDDINQDLRGTINGNLDLSFLTKDVKLRECRKCFCYIQIGVC